MHEAFDFFYKGGIEVKCRHFPHFYKNYLQNVRETKKNGYVVGIKTVVDEDELMLITESGMIVRCPVKDIRTMGRSTQGVKVISLKEKDRVVSIAKVVAKEEE